jgi:hypothetical protein
VDRIVRMVDDKPSKEDDEDNLEDDEDGNVADTTPFCQMLVVAVGHNYYFMK